MPSAVRLRENYSAEELRRLARRSKDVNRSRRLLSLAAVRDGMDRGSAAKIGGEDRRRRSAAKIGGMDRQTLRDWFHRFNASGGGGSYRQLDRRPEASLVGAATGPIRTDRRGRAGSREGWGRALAADRPQARHR